MKLGKWKVSRRGRGRRWGWEFFQDELNRFLVQLLENFIYQVELYSQFTLLWNNTAGRRTGENGGRMVTSVKSWVISFFYNTDWLHFVKLWLISFECVTYISFWNCELYLFPEHTDLLYFLKCNLYLLKLYILSFEIDERDSCTAHIKPIQLGCEISWGENEKGTGIYVQVFFWVHVVQKRCISGIIWYAL